MGIKEHFREHGFYYTLILISYGIWTALGSQLPFFSDNVTLISKLANWYFDTDLQSIILPTELDSGHPPFYAYTIAFLWTIFGKSLWVHHVLTGCFSLLLGISFYHLARYFLPAQHLLFALLCLGLEPCLLTQSLIGGLDVSLTALYFLALVGICYRRPILLIVATSFMVLFSLRGIIGIGLIALSEWVWRWYKLKEKSTLRSSLFLGVRTALHYLPAILITIFWLRYHYTETGFYVFNYEAAWAADYSLVTWKEFIWNGMIVGWRFLDNGRILLWGILLYALFGALKTGVKNKLTDKQIELSLITFLPLFFYVPIIIYRNIPILHRYFMVYYLLVTLLVLALFPLFGKRSKSVFKMLIPIFLISGHFWIYPIPIANGWDATLAHLPYYKQRTEVLNYLKKNNIRYDQVLSEFPMIASKYYTDLQVEGINSLVDKDKAAHFDGQYFIDSNIMNDVPPEWRSLLSSNKNWKVIHQQKNGLLYMRLYEKVQEE